MPDTLTSFDNDSILWSIATDPTTGSLCKSTKRSWKSNLTNDLKGETKTVTVLLHPAGLTDDQLNNWKDNTLASLKKSLPIKSADVYKKTKKGTVPPLYYSVHSLHSLDGSVRSRILSTKDTMEVFNAWYSKDMSKGTPGVLADQFRPIDTQNRESA